MSSKLDQTPQISAMGALMTIDADASFASLIRAWPRPRGAWGRSRVRGAGVAGHRVRAHGNGECECSARRAVR